MFFINYLLLKHQHSYERTYTHDYAKKRKKEETQQRTQFYIKSGSGFFVAVFSYKNEKLHIFSKTFIFMAIFRLYCSENFFVIKTQNLIEHTLFSLAHTAKNPKAMEKTQKKTPTLLSIIPGQ